MANKENKKNNKKNKPKSNKKLRNFLIVFFTLFSAGLITAIVLLATGKIFKKEEPIETGYKVQINQPESEKWELTVNGKKGEINVNYEDKLSCIVQAKASTIDLVPNDSVIYYIIVKPLEGGSEKEVYPFELTKVVNKEIYTSKLNMYWKHDISISIASSSDYEASYYSKDEHGVVDYVYVTQTLFDSTTYEYIEKINVLDQTTIQIKRDEFDEEIWVGSKLSAILPGFLDSCTKFNKPIHFENNTIITDIEDAFLWNCYSFNQPLNLPDSVQTISGDFMYSCKAFNQPFGTKNITKIDGKTFMYDCEAFNSEFTIGSSLDTLPSYFLTKCSSFNQDLVIPETVTMIQDGFMLLCNNMQSTITINCPETAFTYLLNSQNICSTDDPLASCFSQGIKIAGTNKDKFIETFPNINIDEGNKVYRKLIPTNY